MLINQFAKSQDIPVVEVLEIVRKLRTKDANLKEKVHVGSPLLKGEDIQIMDVYFEDFRKKMAAASKSMPKSTISLLPQKITEQISPPDLSLNQSTKKAAPEIISQTSSAPQNAAVTYPKPQEVVESSKATDLTANTPSHIQVAPAAQPTQTDTSKPIPSAVASAPLPQNEPATPPATSSATPKTALPSVPPTPRPIQPPTPLAAKPPQVRPIPAAISSQVVAGAAPAPVKPPIATPPATSSATPKTALPSVPPTPRPIQPPTPLAAKPPQVRPIPAAISSQVVAGAAPAPVKPPIVTPPATSSATPKTALPSVPLPTRPIQPPTPLAAKPPQARPIPAAISSQVVAGAAPAPVKPPIATPPATSSATPKTALPSVPLPPRPIQPPRPPQVNPTIPSPSPEITTSAPKSGKEFEERVLSVLKAKFPECVLTSVPAFPVDTLPTEAKEDGSYHMASEVDFLMHLRVQNQDWLLLIESKLPDLTAEDKYLATNDSPWLITYSNSEAKDIKRQLLNQCSNLRKNVQPLEGRKNLRFKSVIVSYGRKSANDLEDTSRESESELHLTSFKNFPSWLEKNVKPHTLFRVQQSHILRRLRQGQATAELGHPEIPNAIAYARRVRGFLDSELFRHFNLPGRQWAINGTAGMGKSVLLGYALVALSSGWKINRLGDGTIQLLEMQKDELTKSGLPALEKRRIILAAHSEKQRQMLVGVYQRIQHLYHEIDPNREYRKIRPSIKSWSQVSDEDLNKTNVLLVDEAHDLTPEDQARIKAWHDKASDRYLVIACDRHQKLRLLGSSAPMLQGFDFTNKTKRLRRNYRNPFPVHAAAISLLFRWFAGDGPKVTPAKDDYTEGLGINWIEDDGATVTLGAREDAHPANNWSHLVGKFHSPLEAFDQVKETALGKDEVLWVRFSPEHPDFNYESLHRYTYHNLLSNDASDITDKYIKGQEFPLVIIEGFPDAAEWDGQTEGKDSLRMWQARRLIYLAASRANVFLFFIESPKPLLKVGQELDLLIHTLSRPDPTDVSPSGKKWGLSYRKGDSTLPLKSYLKLLGTEFAEADNATSA